MVKTPAVKTVRFVTGMAGFVLALSESVAKYDVNVIVRPDESAAIVIPGGWQSKPDTTAGELPSVMSIPGRL